MVRTTTIALPRKPCAEETVLARCAALEATCRDFAVPLKAAALQFCARPPAVSAIAPGAKCPAKAGKNAALRAMPLPEGLWTALDSAALRHSPKSRVNAIVASNQRPSRRT